MNKPQIWLVISFIFCCIGCNRIFLKKEPVNTPTVCFDLLWSNVNDKYAYFDYKKIDWDSVKRVYAPKVSDEISQDSLFSVLSNMLSELRDGHVNLATTVNRSRYWEWHEAYSDNYNSNFVFRQYFKSDYHLTGSLPNQILPDSIGLIHYGSFSSPVIDEHLDYVMKRFQYCKGIIFDVRDNGGGAIFNVFKLMSRFVDKKTLVGYSFFKMGKGRNDFSSAMPLYVEPYKRLRPFLKPVVILTNRSCYSATTHFAGFMSQLPNVILVGDKTGGGGGIPISADLPNGWQYRFSATYQTLADGFNFENGIAPDFSVNTGAAEELQGKDAIIEKGISLILEKNKNAVDSLKK